MIERKIVGRVYLILLVSYTLSFLRYNLQTNSKVADTAVILIRGKWSAKDSWQGTIGKGQLARNNWRGVVSKRRSARDSQQETVGERRLVRDGWQEMVGKERLISQCKKWSISQCKEWSINQCKKRLISQCKKWLISQCKKQSISQCKRWLISQWGQEMSKNVYNQWCNSQTKQSGEEELLRGNFLAVHYRCVLLKCPIRFCVHLPCRNE